MPHNEYCGAPRRHPHAHFEKIFHESGFVTYHVHMSHRVRIAWYSVAVCVCIHAGTLLLGSWVWWLDIFTHFQLQYVLAGLVTTFVLWLSTRNLPITLFTAIYTLCIGLWILSTLTFSSMHASTAEVDILYQNVLFGQSNSNHARMAEVIHGIPARVYAFVEPHPTFIATFEKALGAPPVIYHSQGGSSCAVFVNDAELVVRNAFLLHDRDSHDPLCVVEFETFDLFVAHPLPPLNKHRFERQHNLFAVLKEQIQSSESAERPWVVVGDFNASLYSPRMREAFSPWLTTQHYTWGTHSLLALPIDHAFSNRPITIKTYPAGTSDHKGLGIFY